MTTSIVFTFIGSDKPGLIGALSNTVSEHGGNWLESRMSQLAGQFAGIARVQIASTEVERLIDALEQLSTDGLSVVIQTSQESVDNNDHQHYELSLVGHDRPNIIKELSNALALHNINVCEMNTDITSAPMTAVALFKAHASIQVPRSLDIAQLNAELEDIAEQLDVDIRIED